MRKKTAITLISLIPVLIILVSTFSSEIASMVGNNGEENLFEISMIEKLGNSGFNYELLMEHTESKIYVPNYDAEVTITPLESNIHMGEYLKFKINIKDKGILPLDRPYFYIYVVDSNDELRSCFPNCIFDNSKYLKKWSTTSRLTISSGKNYDFKIPILPMKINENLFGFYTNSLINGSGEYIFESGTALYTSNEVSFYYSFLADNVGNWEVYVLVFNEDYLSRDGRSLFQDYDRDNNDYLVNFGKNIITVKGVEEKITNKNHSFILFIKILGAFIASILTFVAVYFPLSKHYDKFVKFMKEVYNKKELYVGLIIILLLFLIIQYLIMR